MTAMTTTAPSSTSAQNARTAPALRTVESIHGSTSSHWVGDGFYVSTYFPSRHLAAERASPFVLMDYGPGKDFAPRAHGKRGMGWHPHHGIQIVTLGWEGWIAHRDNAGNVGVIGPGDVQWMTAGAGIFHEEYHEESFTRHGGRMHMMHLWVSLPRAKKMAPPDYQAITKTEIPSVQLVGGGQVRVIAGDYEDARGPARAFTPITMLDADLSKGGRLSVPLPATYNAMAFVTKGRLRAGDRVASTGELVLFANDAPCLELVAEDEAHVILFSGAPLDEPVVGYGPFVMSTTEEIREAIADVNPRRT